VALHQGPSAKFLHTLTDYAFLIIMHDGLGEMCKRHSSASNAYGYSERQLTSLIWW